MQPTPQRGDDAGAPHLSRAPPRVASGLWWTHALLSVAAVLLGAAHSIAKGAALARFAALEMLPRVEALAIVGALGPAIAGWCAMLCGVYAMHVATSPRQAAWHAAGAATLAVFALPPAALLVFAGSAIAWRYWFGQAIDAFVAGAGALLQTRDVLFAVVVCTVNAGLVAALLLAGRRWWTSERRSLRWKLAIAAVTFVLANAGLRLALPSS